LSCFFIRRCRQFQSNPPRALNIVFVVLTDSVEGYRELAISSPRLWRFGHSTGGTAEATRGQDKREKKRDKQEVDRWGRDERSRLPSKTFPSYIPRETRLSSTTIHLVATPSSYSESRYQNYDCTQLQSAICANCLSIMSLC